MKNIEESPVLIGFRGQLYEGERKKMFNDCHFAYGDGEYFTTHYGDGSSYAKANTTNNRDLGGNIDKLSKELDISYLEAKEFLTQSGDGTVMTALIVPSRMMTFGGQRFVDIDNEGDFRRRFNMALVEIDVPSEDRERAVNFVIKHNNSPEKVSEYLIRNQMGGSLRQYASLCNCDAFKLSSNITPSGSIHKDEGVEHIVVLDDTKCKTLRWDDPIAMSEDAFSPSVPHEEFSKQKDAYLEACRSKEQEIKNKVNFAFSIHKSAPKKAEATQEATANNAPKMVSPSRLKMG